MPTYSIGEIASTAGVAASTLRYYESVGLLDRPPRASGQRRYSREVLTRLALISLCKQLGFDLSEVRTVLDGLTKGDRSTARFKKLAAAKLPKVEESITQALLMKELLLQATSCKCPTLEDCSRRAAEAGLLACPPPSTEIVL